MSRTQASAGRSQTYFGELIDAATANLVGDEVLLANIAGEHTDFIRLNNNDVAHDDGRLSDWLRDQIAAAR